MTMRHNHKYLLAATVVAALSLCAQAQTPVDYAARELAARPETISRIQSLRATIDDQQLTFEVGNTGVADADLSKITGLKLPPDLAQQAPTINRRANAKLQQEQKRKQNFLRKQSHGVLPLAAVAPTCSAAAQAFDWRDFGKVSPIQDQKLCGDCWAFASVAAFETSYLIRNSSQPGASEQHVLNCSGGGDCTGGFPLQAFIWMESPGDAERSLVPYVGQKSACNSNVKAIYTSVAAGFVEEDAGQPSTDDMKQAICEHGAIVVAMVATPLLQHYTAGIFNEQNTGDVNHAITIVGWDDAQQAWLVKNSWGPVWGTNGFGWVKYGSNKIGTAATWVEATDPRYDKKACFLKRFFSNLFK